MSRRPFLLALLLPFLAACVVTTSGAPPEAAQTPDDLGSGEVPLRVLDAGESTLALVPVMFAGRGPYLFALDTGASNTVVDTSVADEIGLERTGERREVSGVVGRQSVEIARVEQWSLGPVELGPGEVALLDLPAPEQGEGLQGLLGSDVLSGSGAVTVDYEAGVLRLDP
ncbi:retropepsin-like aspartic protease [Pseudonocardia sp.]|uniref:retropepsin-like aspartic protease n=1 Tax=Pseudonocardia sp. TaxID=60912 RepID=UPI00261CB013|nr:retropepsin-like aspartic protease [Pseudonocardia sp.]